MSSKPVSWKWFWFLGVLYLFLVGGLLLDLILTRVYGPWLFAVTTVLLYPTGDAITAIFGRLWNRPTHWKYAMLVRFLVTTIAILLGAIFSQVVQNEFPGFLYWLGHDIGWVVAVIASFFGPVALFVDLALHDNEFKTWRELTKGRGGFRALFSRIVRWFQIKPIVGWVIPAVLLLGEFLWFGLQPLSPYAGPTPNATHYVVTFQNASRWDITSRNPLGQLTSFLVFDGWTNIGTILFSAITLVVVYSWTRRNGGWRIAGLLFLSTNLGGLIAPMAIYAFPPTPFASWGMSSASFASLGFAVAMCGAVIIQLFPTIFRYRRLKRFMLIVVLGWFLFGAGLMAEAENPNLLVESVHGLGFTLGFALGIIAVWKSVKRPSPVPMEFIAPPPSG